MGEEEEQSLKISVMTPLVWNTHAYNVQKTIQESGKYKVAQNNTLLVFDSIVQQLIYVNNTQGTRCVWQAGDVFEFTYLASCSEQMSTLKIEEQ